MTWISDIGPRDENQDLAVAHLHEDGSWLIAVADGLGGHPRGAEAADAAIGGLPDQIDSPGQMRDVFSAAHERVAALTPQGFQPTRTNLRRCPATTMCVAAWTATGGLLVGCAGDTQPVLLWRENATWFGRSLGSPHRNNGLVGFLTRYVGAPTDVLICTDLAEDDYAVAIVSDGIWEPILSETYVGANLPPDPIAAALSASLTPDDTDADSIAARIMTAAQSAGLDDNATIAVAAVAPAGDADAV